MTEQSYHQLLALSQLLAKRSRTVLPTVEELNRVIAELLPVTEVYSMWLVSGPANPLMISLNPVSSFWGLARAELVRMVGEAPSDRVVPIQFSAEWASCFTLEDRSLAFAPVGADGIRVGGILAVFRSVESAGAALDMLRSIAEVAAVHVANAMRNDSTAEKLTYVLEHDTVVTQLPNSVLLRRRVSARIESCTAKAALLFLDLDGFKRINHDLGYTAGDRVLSEVARRWREVATTLGHDATLARMGGDEFAVFLPEPVSESAPDTAATRLLEVLREPFVTGTRSCAVKASAGISLYPADGQNTEELLRCAEMAMFTAKLAGGDRFNYHGASMAPEPPPEPERTDCD